MPVFRITHFSSRQPDPRPLRRDTTDWVCPTGYDSNDAAVSFHRQFPSSPILSIEELRP